MLTTTRTLPELRRASIHGRLRKSSRLGVKPDSFELVLQISGRHTVCRINEREKDAHGKLPAAHARMRRDQLTDELHFRCADHSAPIAKLACHVPERSRDRNRT